MQHEFFNAAAHKMPPPAKSGALITYVGPESVADLCGLSKGDRLMSIGHRPPVNVTEPDRLQNLTVFEIYNVNEQAMVTIEAKQVHIGIDFQADRDSLAEAAGRNEMMLTDLADFYHDADDESMLYIIDRLLQPGMAANFYRFIGRKSLHQDIQLLAEGMRHFYTGQYQPAIDKLSEFVEGPGRGYSSTPRAMAASILARSHEKADDDESAARMFDYAYYLSDEACYLEQLSSRSLPVSSEYHRYYIGEQFVDNYHGKRLWPEGDAKPLAQSLAELGRNQLHIVVLMSGYRDNGPYEWFLTDFLMYAKLRPELFKSIDIITENDSEAGYWGDAERFARQVGAIDQILLDETSPSLAERMAIDGTPTVLTLDNNNTVVYEGKFDCALRRLPAV